MLTAKHTLQEVADAVALQVGSSITKPDITEYDGERLVWRLQAESAQEEKNVVRLEQPRLVLHNKKDEKMPLQASQAWYDKQAKTVLFEGDVIMGYVGWTLTTQRMTYDETSDMLMVNGRFKLVQDGMNIRGKKMSISRQTGILKVMQGVHMDIAQTP